MPVWQVLHYFFKYPEHVLRGAQVVRALPTISKSAIYNALHGLERIRVVSKATTHGGYQLNRDVVWLRPLMLANNVVALQPLVDRLAAVASKIVLFGSRSTAEYDSASDYDVFIVSSYPDQVRKIVRALRCADHLQLIITLPEEWLGLHEADPELYQSIQQGVALWERK